MKKIRQILSFFALSISLICVSCNTNHVESIDSSSISIDIDNCQDLETQSFIDKIEIIPLETNDNCLLDQYDHIIRKTKCFDFWERNVLFPKTKRSFFRTPTLPFSA